MRVLSLLACCVIVGLIFLASCSASRQQPAQERAKPAAVIKNLLPGMPAVVDARDIYSEVRTGNLNPAIANALARIYVPNAGGATVDVIDPSTYQVIDHLAIGRSPQHVVPSWDMKKLWVTQDLQDQITMIDPATGKKGRSVSVEDPYNLYFTPNGKYAVVVAERLQRLDFRDAKNMRLVHSVKMPCEGVNHIEFSANGRELVATCEFSGELVRVDVLKQRVIGKITLKPTGMPQDVKLSPDGKIYYVANLEANGVHLLAADTLKQTQFIVTGKGAHGLLVSRDSKSLYVANRGEGSVSVIGFQDRAVKLKWKIPGGGSPDTGGISADGRVLWLSGRYNDTVYAIDTITGVLLANIEVGRNPHGLCVYPQPGRYSLGHNGVFR